MSESSTLKEENAILNRKKLSHTSQISAIED